MISALLLTPWLAGCAGLGNGPSEGIYRVRPDGSEIGLVADVPAIPSWSPDGNALAWSSDQAVWVAESNGSGREKVADSPRPNIPTWRPDGNAIAFVDNERRTLSVVPLDGGQAVEVSLLPEGWQEREAPLPLRNVPAWSPDGQRLALVAWDGSGDEIYVVEGDGGGMRRLSSVRASGEPIDLENRQGATKAIADAAWPAWSPDGDRLAFTLIPEVARSTGGLYLVTPEGDLQQRQTSLVPLAPPSWSPDGRALLFIARHSGGVDLFLLFPARKTARNLTNRNVLEPVDAAWSPNGLSVAFAADGAIYNLDVATEQARFVVDTPLVDLSPRWSADGSWIAFRSEADLFQQPSLPAIA
ncbi:MAG TPA: LpqB family beta-propeller domain-containing protein [Thermomicrobiales bacterium]|nr:LpqB family beta-propeller domain-containing protein [Thermomicrobiales bacterium]